MKCDKCGSSVELGPFGIPVWRLKEIWDSPHTVEGHERARGNNPWWWNSIRAIETEMHNRGYFISQLSEVRNEPIERRDG